MRNDFRDILRRIPENPKWYDFEGTPRYDEFHPDLCGVYWEQVVLFEIKCQECGKTFLVAHEQSSSATIFQKMWEDIMREKRPDVEQVYPSIKDTIKTKTLTYGDPPRHGKNISQNDNCVAGDTMSSIVIRTVQFWTRVKDNGQMGWEPFRVPELENVYIDEAEDDSEY
jgi:hypothetical protein